MGWTEKRIQQYTEGQKAWFLEKILLGYYNTVAITLFIIGVPILIYGLWMRHWLWIFAGTLATMVVGNLYAWCTGWAEKRIEQYRTGARPPTWWEKRGLEEAHPVFFWMGIVSSVLFFYGLWAHNWWLIGIGLAIGFLGRFIPWLDK